MGGLSKARVSASVAHMEPDLVAPRAQLAYYDRHSITLPRQMAPLEVWRRMMARPLPLIGLAFRIRDAIAARFGVKRIAGFSGAPVQEVQVGDKLDFFLVERLSPTALTLTERDRHLDVMIAVTVEGRALAITASVVTHNAFGRAYMLPVAPAHKLIVWAMLRRLRKGLEAESAAWQAAEKRF